MAKFWQEQMDQKNKIAKALRDNTLSVERGIIGEDGKMKQLMDDAEINRRSQCKTIALDNSHILEQNKKLYSSLDTTMHPLSKTKYELTQEEMKERNSKHFKDELLKSKERKIKYN